MSIANMNFKERSLLFAKLAKIAYYTEKKATSQAKAPMKTLCSDGHWATTC